MISGNLFLPFFRNMMKLKEGMGDKLSVVANLMGTAVICLAQAFPLGWELTLACCTVVPFSIGASIILTNVSLYIAINLLFLNLIAFI